MQEQELQSRVSDYVEFFNGGHRERWLGLFSEALYHEDPIGAPARTTRSELAEFWDRIRAQVVSISITAEGVFIDQEKGEAVILGSILSEQFERTDRLEFADHFVFGSDGLICSLRAWVAVVRRL